MGTLFRKSNHMYVYVVQANFELFAKKLNHMYVYSTSKPVTLFINQMICMQ